MLQLRLELFIVDLLFVADLRVGTFVFEVLLAVLDLVQYLNIRRYLLLPVLDLQIVAVGHGEAVAIVVDGLVLSIVILLALALLTLARSIGLI